MAEPETFTLYHGALDEYKPDPNKFRFYTTDKGHAAYFGDVTEHKASFANPAHLDVAKMEVPVGREGDSWLFEIANQKFGEGHDALIVKNWEGDGLTILTRDSLGEGVRVDGGAPHL